MERDAGAHPSNGVARAVARPRAHDGGIVRVRRSAARARFAAVTEPGDAAPPRARRRAGALAGGLAAAAFPLAVLANDVVYGYVPGPDALVYLSLARQFARLELLDPQTNVTLAPGYSALLAAIGWIAGFAPLLLVVVQAALYLGAVELFVRTLTAQRVLRPGLEPLLARGLLLGNPNLWFLAGTLGAELLVATLLLVITALLLRWRTEAGMRSGWLASAACGLLAVTRFEWSLLPLLAAVMLRGGSGRAARRIAVLLLGPVLALSGTPGATRRCSAVRGPSRSARAPRPTAATTRTWTARGTTRRPPRATCSPATATRSPSSTPWRGATSVPGRRGRTASGGASPRTRGASNRSLSSRWCR